jgi:hypothetical protein
MLCRELAQHVQPFFQRKQGLLVRIVQDGHDQLIEDLAPALNQVKMAVSNGIKRTGVDGDNVLQVAPRRDRLLVDFMREA